MQTNVNWNEIRCDMQYSYGVMARWFLSKAERRGRFSWMVNPERGLIRNGKYGLIYMKNQWLTFPTIQLFFPVVKIWFHSLLNTIQKRKKQNKTKQPLFHHSCFR